MFSSKSLLALAVASILSASINATPITFSDSAAAASDDSPYYVEFYDVPDCAANPASAKTYFPGNLADGGFDPDSCDPGSPIDGESFKSFRVYNNGCVKGYKAGHFTVFKGKPRNVASIDDGDFTLACPFANDNTQAGWSANSTPDHSYSGCINIPWDGLIGSYSSITTTETTC